MRKELDLPWSGPCYLHGIDRGRFADADLLSERRGAEAPAGGNIAKNGSADAVLPKGDRDMGADCRPVRDDTFELYRYPVVVVLAGIAIKGIVESIPFVSAARLDEDILVTVVVEIGDSHTVSFL